MPYHWLYTISPGSHSGRSFSSVCRYCMREHTNVVTRKRSRTSRRFFVIILISISSVLHPIRIESRERCKTAAPGPRLTAAACPPRKSAQKTFGYAAAFRAFRAFLISSQTTLATVRWAQALISASLSNCKMRSGSEPFGVQIHPDSSSSVE